MRRIIADACDRNAQTFGFSNIHVVVAGTAQRKQMHAVFGQNPQGIGIGMIIDENTGTAAAGGLAGGIGRQRRLDE